MTPQKRIHELKTRQMYVGSSMVIKLSSGGETGFYYTVWAWLDQGETDSKFIVSMGVYRDEDPDILIKDSLKIIGLRKLKLGVPIPEAILT